MQQLLLGCLLAFLSAASEALASGAAGKVVGVPWLGFGIAGLGERTAPVVACALRAGFRLFDSATKPAKGDGFGYDQVALGQALHESGIAREDLFLVTKIHPLDLGHISTLQALERACKELGTHYIDLALLHWPFCVVEFCGRGERGAPLGDAQDSYLALAEARRHGLVRAIGVSNFDAALLSELLLAIGDAGEEPPAVLQNPLDPINPPPRSLLRLLQQHNIILQGVGLLGYDMQVLRRDSLLNRRTEKVNSPIAAHRTVQRIAAKHMVDPALVPFAWAVEHSWAALYSSAQEAHIEHFAKHLLPGNGIDRKLQLSFRDVSDIDDELDGFIRMGVVPYHVYRDPFDRHFRLDTKAAQELQASNGLPAVRAVGCSALATEGESLKEAGFAIVRDLLEPSAVESAWRAIRRILRDYSWDVHGHSKSEGGALQSKTIAPALPMSLHEPGEPQGLGAKIDLVMRRRETFDATSIAWLAPLILSRRLLDFVACALQTEEVRLAFMPFIRATPPGDMQFDWHQDWIYLRGRVNKYRDPNIDDVEEAFRFAESLLIVHIPLTATRAGSGGLSYSVGSHKHGLDISQWSPRLQKEDRFGEGNLKGVHFYRDGDRIEHKVGVENRKTDSEELSLEIGDVSAHTAFTWHRSRDNTSPNVRWHLEAYFQDARAPLRHEPMDLLLRSLARPSEVIDSVPQWLEAVLMQQVFWAQACRDPDAPTCV